MTIPNHQYVATVSCLHVISLHVIIWPCYVTDQRSTACGSGSILCLSTNVIYTHQMTNHHHCHIRLIKALDNNMGLEPYKCPTWCVVYSLFVQSTHRPICVTFSTTGTVSKTVMSYNFATWSKIMSYYFIGWPWARDLVFAFLFVVVLDRLAMGNWDPVFFIFVCLWLLLLY